MKVKNDKKHPEWIKENVELAEYTTFKIGGPAKYFCVVKDKDDLIEAVSFAKKTKLPYFILGGGSNLLVSDDGFDGLVIKIQNTKYKIPVSAKASASALRASADKSAGEQNIKVLAGAGMSLAKLLIVTANAGLSGLEWSAGIPGATLGGAVRGNAGAFEAEMKDIVRKVEAFDARDGKTKVFKNKDCKFGYRKSIFSAKGGSASGGKKNPDLIIFSVELELKKSDKKKVREKIKEIFRYRAVKHPKFPSAGSIFKNLENIRARDLLEKAGLKGKKIGGAQISEQHANFIINTGKAKAKDVLSLIDLAKKEVKNKFGVDIEEEVKILGKF